MKYNFFLLKGEFILLNAHMHTHTHTHTHTYTHTCRHRNRRYQKTQAAGQLWERWPKRPRKKERK